MRQDVRVRTDAVASVLARADAAGRLPRLGGIARPTGVVVVSERFWAFAGTDGTVREGPMPRRLALCRRVLLRGRTLSLHGAEHRAIGAAEERNLRRTWDGAARPSRFSPRCGTNFAAITLPVAAALQLTWPLTVALWTPVVVVLVALAVSMEIWQVVQSSSRRPLRALLAPGLALQRLTTREPSLGETRVALVAVASVLRRELADLE